MTWKFWTWRTIILRQREVNINLMRRLNAMHVRAGLAEGWLTNNGDTALIDITPGCQAWGQSGVESQEVCPACGHYALMHLLDGCSACQQRDEEAWVKIRCHDGVEHRRTGDWATEIMDVIRSEPLATPPWERQ